MKNAAQIIYRRLTAADFFNINKPKGSEARGGGQSYIDFPTSAIRSADWVNFFAGVKASSTHSGPLWKFTAENIGVGRSQIAEIGQRRPASYNIRAQKLGTKESNRLYAWHPDYTGFPKPVNPAKRTGIQNLVIYLVRSTSGEFWAGWFQAKAPDPAWQVDDRLRPMFTREAGYIELDPDVAFDETDAEWPFRTAAAAASALPARPAAAVARAIPTSEEAAPITKQMPSYRQKTEEEAVEDLMSDDVSPEAVPEKKQVMVTILRRNQRAVANLKALYGGQCQLTGTKYVFKKPDGSLYCEAHHLILLGKGGADSPRNLIVVSPLIHRMFHYARVSGLDLTKIVDNKLQITINDEPYTITWHPKHAEIVNAASQNDEKSS